MLRAEFVKMSFGTLLAVLILGVTVLPARAQLQSRIFAGTWGEEEAGDGRVFRYRTGTSWDELSPPGGLADAVWDLEWFEGELWAVTMDGAGARVGLDPFSADERPHGHAGRVWRYDGTSWTDMSRPGGWDSAVTTVTAVSGEIYITVDQDGLYRHDGPSTWTLLGGVTRDPSGVLNGGLGRVGQAINSSSHEGREMLYLGEDNQDIFWTHDPSAGTACGDVSGSIDPGCSRFEPSGGGDVCQAQCWFGSCIHAFAEHDAGPGAAVYAGAYSGAMYRYDHATRLFVQLDRVNFDDRNHVLGLASYRGLLWVGMDNGDLWSTPDASAPSAAASSYVLETSFDDPISEMLTVEVDDLMWMGFGGVPYRWVPSPGAVGVRTWDGSNSQARGLADTGAGVLALLAVIPEISCDAGPEQVVECEGETVAVTLDGSASEAPAPALGLGDLSYAWEGDFLEGTATGVSPTVTYPAGCVDHVVTLTVSAGPTLSESCETIIHIVDTVPPTISAALAPRPPASPASPRSALPAASVCSAPTSGIFRVVCGAEDSCSVAPELSARVHLTRHEFDDGGDCVELIETVDVDCGVELELHLLASPCPARPPRSPQAAQGTNSEGLLLLRGEVVLLEVTAVDDCGNSAGVSLDPSLAPCSPPDAPPCCPALAAPPAAPCSVDLCGG